MKHLLIVYHSQTGNTARLAEAALAGAGAETDTETRLLRAFDAGLDDLLWCHGLLLGTPENFGYMSGAIKDFFDRTYTDAEPLDLQLPYALFVSAGNDGSGAVREMDRILRGYPMKKVADPVIAKGDITPAHLAAASELGLTLAAGLAFGIF
ncbi:flavodoxin family protein [Exilibacterium tricleocarpae]|uniref:Flavodoxin family protein n=1 Tax=Exilibacterium tricleocarpae TaxID=2591008 RepID=A0A545TVS4_9GAMM|nr:NAD(P)H-dependent oxidoreductase [Exilibacterium tricleocarpae]TQV81328.1 flavodoxin family protein [Exilibacterium tricleocarpae]